ncbi:MAG TPA: flavodoxin domain-containing protein [Chitinophagaceae bacterium]|nr:flavodoxin domain-containing protein [Chitinophagaceae bacterium]
MLKEPKLKTLLELVQSSTPEELIWINGYLSGIVANAARKERMTGAAAMTAKKITLVYGTETGNAKRLATQLAAAGKKKGIAIKLSGLDQYRLTDLEKEEYFFVVVSTQGEGEPPVTAKKFYDHIHQQELSLSRMKYSVLALGDSSYPFFCKTGEDVDVRLRALGAAPFIPSQKCDVDYEADAEAWFEELLDRLQQEDAAAGEKPAKATGAKAPVREKKLYEGKILANINLNDRGSAKETWHIEIAADEPVEYLPGDALGVVPVNRKEVVDRILSLTRANGKDEVATARATAPLSVLLAQHLNICYLPAAIVKQYAAIANQQIPDIRMDLEDLLRIYPLADKEQFTDVVKLLTPIAPRLYSISSSPVAHGDSEVHITVSRNSFLAEDEQRFGLCSEFLGDKPAGSVLNFYIHKNKNFRLPDDGSQDVIMIGPGTGIAPFRSFLSERNANGSDGRNWLFFGEQHFVTDFLYQTEIQEYVQTGVLTRLSLAFSRDQEEKIYVQHRMRQQAAAFFEWLEDGAALYVCGAKEPMGRDVEEALLAIIQQQGRKTAEEAQQYIEELQNEGRYHKDVY